MSHRERLIESGLFQPLTPEAIAQRDYILDLLARGEKIGEKPIWCIFRKDDPFRHVILDGDHECQSAELIQDKLYPYEACVKADRLNNHDPEQPNAGHPSRPPLGMYGTCLMSHWEEWEARHAQGKLEGFV